MQTIRTLVFIALTLHWHTLASWLWSIQPSTYPLLLRFVSWLSWRTSDRLDVLCYIESQGINLNTMCMDDFQVWFCGPCVLATSCCTREANLVDTSMRCAMSCIMKFGCCMREHDHFTFSLALLAAMVLQACFFVNLMHGAHWSIHIEHVESSTFVMVHRPFSGWYSVSEELVQS